MDYFINDFLSLSPSCRYWSRDSFYATLYTLLIILIILNNPRDLLLFPYFVHVFFEVLPVFTPNSKTYCIIVCEM